MSDSLVPVAVNAAYTASALFGKNVIAVAAGSYHSLALCSDGSVAAWGSNDSGQIGDTTANTCLTPTAVNTSSGVSALFGKAVVAVAAGNYHNLAVCSDGSVAAWGLNSIGEVGVGNNTSYYRAPVAVSTATALSGKTVSAVAAGDSHSLALCSDGSVAAWGYNSFGQLGNNSTSNSFVPVAVNAVYGQSAFFGKTAIAVAAGDSHSLVLCSDGSVLAWGENLVGEIGDTTTNTCLTPTAVNTAAGVSALAGHRATGLARGHGQGFSLAAYALTFDADTDGDGISDAAEFLLSGLGLHWQINQPELAASLRAANFYNQTQFDANRTAGQNDVLAAPNNFSLYTLSQVQALNVGVPLLTKDASTGQFKLTIGVKKTTHLGVTPFTDFPITPSGAVINGQGKIEYSFTVPDNAAFFRLESN
jgi:alpha-tubulin suppressor-like RCC1 family protein